MADVSAETVRYVIRDGRYGKSHKADDGFIPRVTKCGRYLRGLLVETVPLEQTAPEDRCRYCFPTGDET